MTPDEQVPHRKNIIRGTLRLSIVAAVLVAIAGAVSSHFDVANEHRQLIKSWQENSKIWRGLRCGEQFLGINMTAYTNAAGLIDIGSAGCSSGKLFATREQIREAASQSAPTFPELPYWAIYYSHLVVWLILALIAFCVVNVLGFYFWLHARHRVG